VTKSRADVSKIVKGYEGPGLDARGLQSRPPFYTLIVSFISKLSLTKFDEEPDTGDKVGITCTSGWPW
jgi:hypothetical protein